MTSVAARIRMRAQADYDRAIKDLTRKPNGMFDEAELLTAMEQFSAEVDVDAVRRKEAKAKLDLLARPESASDADELGADQLVLFNDSYPFGPQRLIRCGDEIVENVLAPLLAKEADLDRARVNRQRAQVWEDRKSVEVTHFRRWADSERDKGRSALDLTWGNCVRETGILRGARS